MAIDTINISDLPTATALTGSELMIVVQGGVTKQSQIVNINTNIIPKGVAMLVTNPTGAVNGWLYQAGQTGVFTNFSGLSATIGDGLLYNGTVWQLIPYSSILNNSTLEQGKNLYNYATRNINQFVNSSTGALSGNSSYDATDYILVAPSTAYTRTSIFLDRMAFYDVNKVFISGVNPGTASFTTPASCFYIRISILKASIDPITQFQVEAGSTETYFEAYGLYLKKALLPNKWVNGSVLSDGSVPLEKTDFLAVGKNKYNSLASGVTNAFKVNNDGTLGASATESSSDYMGVLPSTAYKCNQFVSGLAFYDLNKKFIAGSFTSGTNPAVTSPASAVYCRVSFGLTLKSYFQFEAGAAITPYERFQVQLQKFIGVTNTLNYQDLAKLCDVDIVLPGNIYATSGHEKTLYLTNIIRSNIPLNDYNINVSTTLGKGKFYGGDVITVSGSAYNIGPYYQWLAGDLVNGDAGTYTFTISLYLGNVFVFSKTVNLIVSATTAGTGITRKVCFAGESTTFSGIYPQETRTLFNTDTAMDISLVGSVTQPAGVKHEGYNGFTWLNHNTSASSNIVFSGVVNMNTYESTYATGLATNDWLICLGFINDLAGQVPLSNYSGVLTNIDLYISHMETFFGYFTAKYPGIRVGISTMIPPPNYDAWGKFFDGKDGNGGANARLRDFMMARKIIDRFDTPAYLAAGVHVIDGMSGMDSTFGYTFAMPIPINTRNSGITRTVITDAYHPANVGYYQLADTMYDFLKAKI
jgi:hypothetical protein